MRARRMPERATNQRRYAVAGQKITRIPAWAPGCWVVLSPDAGEGLAGKVRRVRSLTCAITHPEQERALWRVHFEEGRSVQCELVDRLATEEEVRSALRRRAGVGIH
jgi:hypothetical protein